MVCIVVCWTFRLPAVVSDWRFEAGVSNLDGWAVVHFGGQDWSLSGVLIVLWLSGVLIMLGLCGVLNVSWLNMCDSLSEDGLSDDGLSQHWSGISVNSWLLNVSCWLMSVCDGLVSVVDDASIVFADARVWCVDGFWDMADGSVSWSDDVLFRRSMFVVTIDGLSGINVLLGLMMVARDGVLLGFVAVVASDGGLCNISFWLRVWNGLWVRWWCWRMVVLLMVISSVCDRLHQSLNWRCVAQGWVRGLFSD